MNSIQLEDISEFAKTFPLTKDLNDKKIAITGATGLLGSCMVYCLLALNDKFSLNLQIVCVVRNVAKAKSMFGEESDAIAFVEYDFSGTTDLLLPAVDYLVHFASPTASKYFLEKPVETMQIGMNGTQRMLAEAKRQQMKSVVYVSSLEVYGTVLDDSKPLTEDQQGYINPLDARSSYPTVKRTAECLCHAFAAEYGVPVKIARLAQTFGAGISKDDNRVFAQFARSIINKENIVLHTTGELKRCYCYTTDAISALLFILLKGNDGDAYNVANEETYISIIDMAKFLCNEFCPSVKPIIELKDGMGYSPVTKLRLSTDAINTLGWKPEYDLRRMFSNLINSIK